VADELATSIITWLSPKNSQRNLARCELFLLAKRDPEVRRIASVGVEQVRSQMAILFSLMGARHPREASSSTIRYIFSLMYGYTVSSTIGKIAAVDRAQLKALLRAFIALQKEA